MPEERNKKLERQLLIASVIELLAFLGIIFGCLCWTLMIVEGINLAQEYGFIIEHNIVHAFGSMFILLFLILFPLNYFMRKSDYYFTQLKRDIWRRN